MLQIVTLKEAKHKKLQKYYTGIPCKKGHVALRLTSTRRCVECNKINTSSVEKYIYNKDYYLNNKEKITTLSLEYRQRTKNKKAEYDKVYRNLNAAKLNSNKAKYRAAKISKTAKWDLDFTEFVCEEAFELAKLRKNLFGFDWEVDHVIPLQGKEVSGLHVWNNLAVIPASLNAAKGNKYYQD